MRRFQHVISVVLFIAALSAPAFARGSREAGALIGPDEAYQMVQRGEAILVDVRDEASYVEAHLSGAILVPLATVATQTGRLAAYNRTIITYCSCPAEETSAAAAAQLIAGGLDDVLVLKGGIRGWTLAGLPLKSGSRP